MVHVKEDSQSKDAQFVDEIHLSQHEQNGSREYSLHGIKNFIELFELSLIPFF